MSSFFLALVATALATLGGRDALRVARLAAGLGAGAGLLAACWTAAVLAGVAAAWAGDAIAAGMHPDAKAMLAAFALGLAGMEMLVLRDPPAPKEPTRSFFAILLVLAAALLLGSAGFIAFALAGTAGLPVLAAAGAALGAGAVLTCAWAMGGAWERLPLRPLRIGVALAFLACALAVGLSARGLV